MKKSKVFKWALVMGITIVLNLFFNYTVSLFYEEPQYDAYIPQRQVIEPIDNKEECLALGGQWNEYPVVCGDGLPCPKVETYCNPDFTKMQEYENARDVYQRNIFIILVILGVLSLVLGAFVPNEIVVSGLSWGGVLSLFIASTRYWSAADNLVKVLILAAALGALIYVAMKKFSDSSE